MQNKPCKHCQGTSHYSFQCFKIRKPIKQFGKKAREYEEWKHSVAIPYLIRKFGFMCAECGAKENLEVDHLKSRGSRPDLKTDLSNIQFLCTDCHRKKHNQKT